MTKVLWIFLLLAIIGGTLGKRNVLKTIESDDGDIIDCVDFYDQPAFDDPLIKNLTRQIISKQYVEYMMMDSSGPPPIQQIWQRSGSCPKGTVPILRMQEKDATLITDIDSNPEGHVEMAIAYDNARPFQGASGNVAIWKPYVQPNEYSTSIVACASGSFPQSITDVLAVGWTVNPRLFGDNSPRSIIAMTKDTNLILWCYNHGCPGFIQTSRKVVLGAAYRLSVYGDPNQQIVIKVNIYRDSSLPVWKVAIDDEEVGFIPIERFANFVQCDTALWGGLVYNSGVNPTRTEMGNGHFSNEGASKTGAIGNALVNKQGSSIIAEPHSGVQVTRPSCYDIQAFVSAIPNVIPGNVYLFGGPGTGSVTCT